MPDKGGTNTCTDYQRGWVGISTGGGPQARGTTNLANTGDDIERRQSKAMRCGIVRCTRGKTTMHMLWVWHMELRAVRAAGRRWTTIRSVVVCALPHVEGGLHVSGDSAGKRTCGVPSLWRRREDRREQQWEQHQTMYPYPVFYGMGALRPFLGFVFEWRRLGQVAPI